ncbi:MAG: hypothetical protein HC945_00155 [Nitrosarchaeum sp.]|nr:hypothetical protein [Nitrosarchaeum sp.]
MQRRGSGGQDVVRLSRVLLRNVLWAILVSAGTGFAVACLYVLEPFREGGFWRDVERIHSATYPADVFIQSLVFIGLVLIPCFLYAVLASVLAVKCGGRKQSAAVRMTAFLGVVALLLGGFLELVDICEGDLCYFRISDWFQYSTMLFVILALLVLPVTLVATRVREES